MLEPHSKEATVSCGSEEDLRYLNFSIECVIESEIKQWVHEWDRVQTKLNAQQKKTNVNKKKKKAQMKTNSQKCFKQR